MRTGEGKIGRHKRYENTERTMEHTVCTPLLNPALTFPLAPQVTGNGMTPRRIAQVRT